MNNNLSIIHYHQDHDEQECLMTFTSGSLSMFSGMQSGSSNLSVIGVSDTIIGSSPSSEKGLTNIILKYKDIYLEISRYLNHKECFNLSYLNKKFIFINNDALLWKLKIDILFDNIYNANDINNLKQILDISYKEMFFSFINNPINIFKRKLIMHNNSLNHLENGGLFKFQIVNDRIYLLKINWFPKEQNNINYLILYSKRYKRLIASYNSCTQYIIELSKDNNLIFNSIEDLFETSISFILRPFPPSESIVYGNNLNNCKGLYTSNYGVHGNELVYLSFQGEASKLLLRCDNYDKIDEQIYEFGSSQLQCLKITGDENVPRGNLSFVIDINNIIIDHHDIINKTVAIFNGQHYISISLDEVINLNSLCIRGYGIINEIPGIWNPSYSPCIFILDNTIEKENKRNFFYIYWEELNCVSDFIPLDIYIDN